MEKLNEALEITEKELLGISKTLTDEELNRAKEYLIGKTQLLRDRTDFVSGYVGEKVLLENSLSTIENELNRYSKVELNELKMLSEEFLVKEKIKTLIVRK